MQRKEQPFKNRKMNNFTGYFILFLFLSGTQVIPQINLGIDEKLVRFQMIQDLKPLRAGEKFRIEIKAEIKKGWHIYSIHRQEEAPPPTKVEIQLNGISASGPIYETRPIFDQDKVIGVKLAYHKPEAVFYQNFQISSKPLQSGYLGNISIYFTVCSDIICLPPNTVSFPINITIEPGPVRAAYNFHDQSIKEIGHSASLLGNFFEEGFLGFLALAAAMGFVSLAAPCVFPMIPVTLSFFSHQAEKQKTEIIKLATVFVSGMILTFTGIGMVLSVFLGAGTIANLGSNPYLNLFITIIFVVFSLSLMGLFEFKLPQIIQNKLDKSSNSSSGILGVLIMGFTFTITVFTCTVPFVGTLLIAASQGEILWPLIGMFVFASVFSLPFFILALSPSLLVLVQGKRGSWMRHLKVVFGMIELMVALKFASNADLIWETGLLTRDRMILIWIMILLAIFLYLYKTANRALFQKVLSTTFLGVAVWLFTGFQDRSLASVVDSILPPAQSGFLIGGAFLSKEDREKEVWFDNLNEAISLAKTQNKYVFVDFTGYTCVNCRWMEQNIFARKDVNLLLQEKYILVRLYTDGGKDGEVNQYLQVHRFKTIALPFYVILNSNNQIINKYRRISLDPQNFVEFLLQVDTKDSNVLLSFN